MKIPQELLTSKALKRPIRLPPRPQDISLHNYSKLSCIFFSHFVGNKQSFSMDSLPPRFSFLDKMARSTHLSRGEFLNSFRKMTPKKNSYPKPILETPKESSIYFTARMPIKRNRTLIFPKDLASPIICISFEFFS